MPKLVSLVSVDFFYEYGRAFSGVGTDKFSALISN